MEDMKIFDPCAKIDYYVVSIKLHLKSGTIIEDIKSFIFMDRGQSSIVDFILTFVQAVIKCGGDEYRGTTCVVKKSYIIGIEVKVLDEKSALAQALSLDNQKERDKYTIITREQWESYEELKARRLKTLSKSKQTADTSRSKQPVECSNSSEAIASYMLRHPGGLGSV